MKEKLIYEMKYPKIDYLGQYEIDKAEVDKDPKDKKLTSEELFKGICANTQYTPIPKRIQESEDFIKEAIEVSRLYQISTRIVRRDHKICTHFSLDFGSGMRDISRLFGMADEVYFIKDNSGHDIAVCLDFYTHVVVRNGMAVAP